MRTLQLGQAVLTAATANGVGKSLTVADHKFYMAMVTITTAFTTGTLKFLGSIAEKEAVPNFAAAATKTNPYSELAFTRMDTGVLVSGATGIDLSTGAGTTFAVKLTAEALSYLTAALSNITGVGEVTVTISAYGEACD
jgi:hypothetical protein